MFVDADETMFDAHREREAYTASDPGVHSRTMNIVMAVTGTDALTPVATDPNSVISSW